MELSFVIAALRRRLWLVVLLMLAGAAAGFASTSSQQAKYEAFSELLILNRTTAAGASPSNDPDRLIAGEINILRGASLERKVAAKVTGDPQGALDATVRIDQVDKTDVVSVTVQALSAERAQEIANAYATLYIAESEARGTQNFDTELKEIETQLTSLSERITTIEVERSKIPPLTTNLAERARDAQLFEQATSLRTLYNQLIATQTSLRFSSQLKSRSQVLQLADLPTVPIVEPRTTLIGLGGFLGAVLGALAAVAWANASKRLLDLAQLDEILGVTSVGVLPIAKELERGPKVAFENLPDKAAALIDQLMVRAEASAQGDTDALTMAVVGSQRGAGATTVALALAGRFARNGARTVVIDGDLADPEISRSFHALDDAGIPGLLTRLAAARKEPPSPGAPAPVSPASLPPRVFTPTNLQDARVLGVGAPTKARSLHRTNVDLVIEASSRGGVDVVVIDGGPLLDSASTVRLCQVVDVVVLVVPVSRQQIEPLGVINRLLGYRSGDLLTVATRIKPDPKLRPKAEVRTETGGDVDDIIEAATRWRNRVERAPAPDLEDFSSADDAEASRQPVPVAVVTERPPERVTPVVAPPLPASPRLGAPPVRRQPSVSNDPDDDEWVAR